MKKRKRGGPGEINAGSMADIAFLLLIFFLVTTTMDTDVGILRLLPPIVEDMTPPDKVKQRNIYEVLVNDADQLLVEGQPMDIKDLREGAKEFMTNPGNSEDLPERTLVSRAECEQQVANFRSYVAQAQNETDKQNYQKQLEKWEDKLNAVKLLGDYKELPGAAVISLQTGSKTSYDMYVQVQNELEAAVRELRDELSKEKFGKKYTELSDIKEDEKNMIRAIRMVYPQRISEAEPVDVTQKAN
ncbi:MAG: biopolymer transporter ExbD [Flavobacteriales bacterium]|nr:biopolymer transporter ExbD [Flavobacteriales bacterium]MCB9193428.1 biopolymer transporter ExbD [Flavobacteriales bacterium]